MTRVSGIRYCADAIVRYGPHIVVVERLGSQEGLALPGGGQDAGETLSQTIRREIREETGLEFVIEETLETRAEKGRDPRGEYVSTVFLGTAHGTLRDEPGKTRVLLFDVHMFREHRHRFRFDHADILETYFNAH
jgi:ADP-ribose pyrophosphatase YjhB (NUDIX family)